MEIQIQKYYLILAKKHFCGNFSDISFKVNIFYNEKYQYFESTP